MPPAPSCEYCMRRLKDGLLPFENGAKPEILIVLPSSTGIASASAAARAVTARARKAPATRAAVRGREIIAFMVVAGWKLEAEGLVGVGAVDGLMAAGAPARRGVHARP